MKSIIILVAFVFFNSGYVYSENYLCLEEVKGGIFYKESSRKWISGSFNPDNKFIIKQDSDSKNKYTVTIVGESYPDFHCEDLSVSNVNLFCDGMYGSFHFRSNSMRFIYTHQAGYVDGIDNNENTPVISVGKCSPL